MKKKIFFLITIIFIFIISYFFFMYITFPVSNVVNYVLKKNLAPYSTSVKFDKLDIHFFNKITAPSAEIEFKKLNSTLLLDGLNIKIGILKYLFNRELEINSVIDNLNYTFKYGTITGYGSNIDIIQKTEKSYLSIKLSQILTSDFYGWDKNMTLLVALGKKIPAAAINNVSVKTEINNNYTGKITLNIGNGDIAGNFEGKFHVNNKNFLNTSINGNIDLDISNAFFNKDPVYKTRLSKIYHVKPGLNRLKLTGNRFDRLNIRH